MTRPFLAALLLLVVPALGNELDDPDKDWMYRTQWSMNGSTITVTKYGPTRIEAVKNVLHRRYKNGVWCRRFRKDRDRRDDWQRE